MQVVYWSGTLLLVLQSDCIVCFVGVLCPTNTDGHIRHGSAHSWRLYSIAPPGDRETIWWTLTHYPAPERSTTGPCPILVMSSSRLGGDKCKFGKSLVWRCLDLNPWSSTWGASALFDSVTVSGLRSHMYIMHTYIHMHTYIYTYIQTYMHTNMHTCTYAYSHTRIHTHMPPHTHIQTHRALHHDLMI